jgi:hypothetical protein
MWFQNNQLALNLDKTKMIKFTPSPAVNYSLDTLFLNKMLEVVETITFLGFQLDNHLICKGQIDLLLHKVKRCWFSNVKIILYTKY